MTTCYVVDNTQVSAQDFDGEIVAVNFGTGKYFGMQGSGPHIWSMLEQGASLASVTARLEAEYGPLSKSSTQGIQKFLDILVAEAMVVELSGPAGTIPNLDLPSEFEPPALEVHSDLEELILLDPIHDVEPEAGWPIRRTDG